MFKKRRGNKLEKINARWEEGVFVGVKRRSNEITVSTGIGLVNVRSVKRVVKEKRWSVKNLEEVKWAPWHRYKDDEDADGDVPEGVERE